jgi:hypothetical protein
VTTGPGTTEVAWRNQGNRPGVAVVVLPTIGAIGNSGETDKSVHFMISLIFVTAEGII